jgi:preprotein translocase subunit SecD
MNKNLRWKLLTVFAVFVVFFTLGIYPILAQRYRLPLPGWLASKQLKLGLDLQGGVHLVLRVQAEEALQVTTTTTAEQIREELRTANVPVGAITTTSATSFRVEGVASDRDADFRRIADAQAATNYDRNPGVSGNYDFTMKPNIANDLREQAVVQAVETIDRRVNELGVSEPNISRYGAAGDQILVQLPGVSDVARAKEIIRSTALLELKLVEAGPAPTREALLQPYKGQVPPDMEVVPGSGAAGETATFFRR